MKTTLLAAAATALALPAYAQSPLCNGDCFLTGGQAGDYYQYFAPPIQALFPKAWVDVPTAESPGSLASIEWVATHPHSYFFAQGDIVALIAQDQPDLSSKVKIIRGSDIGNEAVLAIMNDRIWERSQGSWAAIAQHARQVRFVTAAEKSGPGTTMRALMKLDPAGLGQARVTYAASMDAAIDAVADGSQDVALMVQFANPENGRFQKVNNAHLHFAPVIMGKMRDLKLPDGRPAYDLCADLDVGAAKPLTTACTPIQFGTGAANDNPDLARVFGAAPKEAFAPRQTGFMSFWRKMQVKGRAAWDSVASATDRAAEEIGKRM